MTSRHFLRALWQATMAMIDTLALEIAGHIAYTGLLSIFPFLIFLAALAGFIGTYAEGMASVDAAFELLPQDVASTLRPVIDEVLRSRDGGLLTLGLLGALWVASNGFDALRIALNTAYRVDEPRPWWQRKARSIGAVVIGGLAFVALSLLVVFGPVIWKAILWISPLRHEDVWAYSLLRYGIATGVLVVALLALHRWLPGRRLTWRSLLPGVFVTTILWIAVASLFSFYVANLGDYRATYGSLGGVISTLLFFYVSAVLFIYGAELNAALLQQQGVQKPPVVADD